MTPLADLHPDLNERDLIPVRDLIDEVRVQERATKLLAATVTWLAAFSAFKKLRLRHGLPTSPGAFHFYGAVLGELKTTGKALLGFLELNQFTLDEAPITKENLEACVRELCCDDVILDMGLLKSDLSAVEAAFA